MGVAWRGCPRSLSVYVEEGKLHADSSSMATMPHPCQHACIHYLLLSGMRPSSKA